MYEQVTVTTKRKEQGASKSAKLVLRNAEGFTLLEVLIAATILAIGMAGILPMFLVAMSNNTRSRGDTQGTLVSQLFLEKIAAVPSTSDLPLTINDCSATPQTITVNTAGTSTGTGANLVSSGSIDWTESNSSIPSGYTAYYQTCGASQMIYEVRWNIKNPASSTLPLTKLISVASRPTASRAGTVNFALPTTLHAISGAN
jgi:prepilin-type N-terminal cleavage/methylation domain-containing protein